MRFSVPIAKEGDLRDRSGFLLLPKAIWWEEHKQCFRETRWLEYATWRERYTEGKSSYFWSPIRWVG